MREGANPERPGGGDNGAPRSPRTEYVTLSLPPFAQYVQLARVTASGLASRLGFSWDEVEDLRLAVDELCHAVLVGAAADSLLKLRYSVDATTLEVDVCLEVPLHGTHPQHPALSELGDRILAALVDSHGTRSELDQASLWIRKSKAPQA